MALTCIEKIIGLVVILIIFNLIFNSNSENFSCGCTSENCPCGMNCPCHRRGKCNYGTPYDDNY
jgi:hypothetical protein